MSEPTADETGWQAVARFAEALGETADALETISGPRATCFPTTVEIGGSKFWVGVHMAHIQGRFCCVGLDVRSFREERQAGEQTDGGGQSPRQVLMNDDWAEITSPVMRALRTSEVIEAAQEPLRQAVLKISESFVRKWGPSPSGRTPEEVASGRYDPQPVRRRGPRPLLSDQVLREVVAPTYLLSAHKPVQAVRVALEESEVLGSRVTIDQARKAVAAARARGFIPPARRTARQQRGQA